MWTWLVATWLSTPVTIDPSSLFVIRVDRDESTLLSGLSHNHAIRAASFRAEANLDSDPGKCTFSVTIPVRKLRVDEPSMRRRFQLEGELDEDDRADIRKNMLADDQLDANNHPEIGMKATYCRLGANALTLEGKLSIRGVTRGVKARLERSDVNDGQVRLKGSIPIRATDFGFEPYSAALGSLKNRDEMRIHIELVASIPP